MHPSLAWRATILQLAWIGAVVTLALALHTPEIQFMLVGGFVGWGGGLIQKARLSAGGGDGTPGASSGIASGNGGTTGFPGSMRSALAKTIDATSQRFAVLFGAFTIAAVMLFAACKNSPPVTVGLGEGGAPVPTCSLISVTVANGSIELCLNPEEIALFVGQVFALRADSGAPTPAEACTVVPTTNVCATPREMSAGANAVLARRRSFLLVDAGLQ